MPSLKEIRGRINSVSATLKITDVNRMISSAKLHKAQGSLNSFLHYKNSILSTFYDIINSLPETNIPLMTENTDAKKVLIVSFSSNTGLCGAFNTNVIKKTVETIDRYREKSYNVSLYTIGKKVYDGFSHNRDIELENVPSDIYDHQSYTQVSEIAEKVLTMYLNREIDEVVMIYNRFKNILTQYILEKKLLPMTNGDIRKDSYPDYIMEPDRKTLVNVLAPQVVKLAFYETFLESLVAEYAARSSAMQAATDNANDLLGELSTQYNKVRQSAITGELIDIVGGSEALK
ncbi:MAG: ATP synthase F1 subunit gamma [Prevotellaceae bacterium]|jgi:F-type H+-transporting ATPase subunit gamma|nr:ATP synthase F1 subunit gamma [Prevotellaceae bacterium]